MIPLLLLAAAVVPYVNSLHGSFHYDDLWDIVRNDHLDSWHNLLAARPLTRWLTFFTLSINQQLHGRDCLAGWHIGNILLHAASVLMLYLVLGRLLDGHDPGPGAGRERSTPTSGGGSFGAPSSTGREECVAPGASAGHRFHASHRSHTSHVSHGACTTPTGTAAAPCKNGRLMPLVAALLMAVHPLASEPVNYIRARFSMLCAIFVLLAVYATARAFAAGTVRRRLAWLAMLAAGIALAGLSKEVGGFFAIALPLLYIVVFHMPRRWGRRLLLLGSPVVAGVFVLGWLAASDRLDQVRGFVNSPAFVSQALGQVVTFWRYVSLAAWPAPWRLTVDHHVPCYPARIHGLGDGDVLLAIAGLLALAAICIRLARGGRPAAAFLLAAVPVGLLPYLFIPTVDMLVEYKFYLPLAAVCGLAGWLASGPLYRSGTYGRAALAVVLLACAAATLARSAAWRTDLALWEDAYRKAPRRARTVNAYAWALLTDPDRPDRRLGLEMARRSLDPKCVDPWPTFDPHQVDTLAEAYFANGMIAEAIAIERQLVACGEGYAEFFRAQLERFERAAAATQPMRTP